MSLFGKLFRNTAAIVSFAIGAGSLLGQDPVVNPPAPLPIPGVSVQDPITPASGWGSGPLGARRTPSPCAPCTPATPCPVTGQPMTTPTGEPVTPPVTQPVTQPNTQAPDFGDLGRGADAGRRTVVDGGYIESAVPRTMARIRFDAGYNDNRPDRGEFFYAKCGCFGTRDAHGVPLLEKNVDYQELSATGEVAFTERFSAFATLPVRFLNPDVNANATGLGDVSFGGKYAFVYNDNRVVSVMAQFYAPSASQSNGLGNGNWWVEPGLLWLERLTQQWQMFGELRFQAPIGVRSDFTGNLLRYGLGTTYVVAQGRWGYVAPVVELVGWTVLSGKELNPDSGMAVAAHGDTIVNAKFGVRVGFGQAKCGSVSMSRSDLYVGYGRALTGEVWYKDLLRVEYRYFF